MAEEFQESELMFQVEVEVVEKQPQEHLGKDDGKANKRKKMRVRGSGLSVPMNIPEAKRWLNYVDTEVSGGEIVPPHLMIGHRMAEEMFSFSVCTGNGRTLKGRDLSQERNKILRMTGFLET